MIFMVVKLEEMATIGESIGMTVKSLQGNTLWTKNHLHNSLKLHVKVQHNGVKQKELYEGKVAGKHIDAVSSPEISAKSNFQIYSAVRHENDNTKIMKELGNMVSKDGEYCDLGSHWWLKLL